ncbi:hypothetical protein DW228_18555 [Bacteroides fragilis]|uniref:Transmembrane protein n=1 Tax=Bacteroides fragilis TaxID=817 RepID=A0A396BVY2_BACFG|nr:hypothetical protein [Bacteroides fragilis]RHH07935.1 hypothetical protein DW228_18555 [Bacteroides fragilis]
MDIVYIIGINILIVLLVVILAFSGYLHFIYPFKTVPYFKLRRDRDESMAKVDELDERLKLELQAKKLNHIMYILFAVVNVVIGTLLMTGFIQQMVSGTILGVIGLIVLAATLLNLVLKPEGKKRIAIRRIAQINNVKRKCCDLVKGLDLDTYENGQNVPDSSRVRAKVIRLVNDCLEELDNEDVRYY